MSKILIVAPFCSLPGEPCFNRFLYLAELLSQQKKHEVTLLTSSFSHMSREQRTGQYYHDSNFKVQMIYEPGYTKNIGIGRAYSHYVFCRNLKIWLEDNHNFNLVYSAYPLIKSNLIISKIKKKYNAQYKIIIDVQDVWPETISSVIPYGKKINPQYLPFAGKANSAYKTGDGIVAVSKTYLSRALSVASPQISDYVYIGSDFETIRKIKPHVFNDKKIRYIYLGAMGHCYDLFTLIEGFNRVSEKHSNIELHLFGDGPLKESLENKAKGNIYFHGYQKYEYVISFAKGCQAAINPIKGNAVQSITNKISDYMSLGIPIINSQKCDELSELLQQTLSVEYEAGDVKSFKAAIEKSLPIVRDYKWQPSSIFNRSKEYLKIVQMIERLITVPEIDSTKSKVPSLNKKAV